MDTIFMNSKNSRPSEYNVLVLKIADKLDLRRGQKSVALSNLSIYDTWKNTKTITITINLKYLHQHGVINLSYQIGHIQYQIFKIILSIFLRNIVNRITFKIKNEYYLELLTPETVNLLGSTESKRTKDKNGEKVHCNLFNIDYQQDSRILYTFVPNKPFSNLLEISPTNHIFLKTFNSEFQEIKVWFTDQTSKSLEVEDKINLTLIIK